jgi:hypothetical protein
MTARGFLWLASILPWSIPAFAAITIEQADVAASTLIVTGQATPRPWAVTLSLGPLATILVEPDAAGRFAWIGNQIPSGCAVTALVGTARAEAAVGHCGAAARPPLFGASGSARSLYPAPGIGVPADR